MTTGLVESRMRGDTHVRFGGRAGETHQPEDWQGAPVRPYVMVVSGTQGHTEGLQEEVAEALRPMGLRLSAEKTRVIHIDEGFDFLGFRIQRHRKRGTEKSYVYTYPSKTALAAVKGKVRALTRQGTGLPLAVLLHQLNPVLRGWTGYFRHGTSKATFDYLRAYTWRRVVIWLRRKHPRATWKWLRGHYLPGWWPTDGEVTLFNPGAVRVTRYRYRAARIPSPWDEQQEGSET